MSLARLASPENAATRVAPSMPGAVAPSDDAILVAYAEGAHEHAFALLTRRYLPAVRQQVSRRLGRFGDVHEVAQSLDDLVHDALLRVHAGLVKQPEPRAITNLSGWVWRDVHFEVVEQLRRALARRKMPIVLRDEAERPADPDQPADESLVAREEAEAFRRCIEQIPPGRPREALSRRLTGATLQEIAGDLGYPHPTAVHRALDAVVELLRRCMGVRERGPGRP